MAATTTLASTTLLTSVAMSDGSVFLTSSSDVLPGLCLWVDTELMSVLRAGVGTGEWVVKRGIEGSRTERHAATSTVYIGRGDQFYATDPQGVPPTPIRVSPHINVVNGKVWVAQGDETGPGAELQYWQEQITTRAPGGALGVRTTTVTP